MGKARNHIKRHAKVLVFACLIVLVIALDQVFCWSSWLAGEQSVQALQGLLEENYGAAVLLYCVATILGCVLLALPGALFAIVAAALFGPFLGTVWCVVAASVGACAAFVAGRYFLRDSVKPWACRNEVIRKYLFDEAEGNAVLLLAITRLVPLFPYNIQNFAYGVTDIRFSTYAWCSFLFMVPGTALYAFGAAGVLDAENRWVYLGVAVVLLAVVTVVGLFLRDRDLPYKIEKAHYPFRNWRHVKPGVVLFPGCNAQGMFPLTMDVLAETLGREADVTVAYDCCGKPLEEYGMEGQQRVVDKIDRRLARAGVTELVCVCPNCYYYLRDKVSIPVVSVYEKMDELGLLDEGCIAGDCSVYPPCPDKARLEWFALLQKAFASEPELLGKTPCCGLGKPGVGKTPQQRADMARRCLGEGATYTYCASCAGCMSKQCGDDQQVYYVLSEVLGVHERPQTSRSFINRARMVFR